MRNSIVNNGAGPRPGILLLLFFLWFLSSHNKKFREEQ